MIFDPNVRELNCPTDLPFSAFPMNLRLIHCLETIDFLSLSTIRVNKSQRVSQFILTQTLSFVQITDIAVAKALAISTIVLVNQSNRFDRFRCSSISTRSDFVHLEVSQNSIWVHYDYHGKKLYALKKVFYMQKSC